MSISADPYQRRIDSHGVKTVIHSEPKAQFIVSDSEMTEESVGDDQSETESDADRYRPGTVVIDREDPAPSEAVVINRPPCTCQEWVAYLDSETDEEVTVAEDNPEYDWESDVIVVAFRESLEDQDSEKLPVEEPIPLAELNCKNYGFPKGRLEIVDESDSVLTDQGESSNGDTKQLSESESGDSDVEADPDQREQPRQDGLGEDTDETEGVTEPQELPHELEALRDRLSESATVSVEWEDTTPRLHVEKLGTEYRIHVDGTIEGDRALRSKLKPLIEEYLDTPDEE